MGDERMVSIVHLSDVHFGTHHRFGPEQTTAGDWVSDAGSPSLAQSLAKDLADFAPGCPAIICITGDITQTSSDAEFSAAATFVSSLRELKVEGQTVPVLLVPGNHDVDWGKSDCPSRMARWCHFIGDLDGRHVDANARTRDARLNLDLVESHRLIVAELNSAAYVSKDTPDSLRGRLDDTALDELLRQLDGVDETTLRDCVRVGLIHHHPVLIPELAERGRGYDAVHGSGRLLRMLRDRGFHLVLHGHKHVPVTFTEDTRAAQEGAAYAPPTFVVCGGSVGTTELPSEREAVNTYNRIKINWLPKSHEYRVAVETRKLVTYTTANKPLLRSRWHWETLCLDDRWLEATTDPPKATDVTGRPFDRDIDDDSARVTMYSSTQGYFPAVRVRPSLVAGQSYEAEVWLEHHPNPDGTPSTSPPRQVTWSAGPRHEVIEVDSAGDRYAATFAYYGPMLVQVQIEFPEAEASTQYVYARLAGSG